MDLADWLGRLGLAQYAEPFQAEGVDLAVLGALSDQDLKDLGVALLGHRRKIMAAAALAPLAAPASLGLSSIRTKQDAERRPITVFFCDLVDSTSLAANLDPEDWRELVGAYLETAAAAVGQYSGHVLKKLGDGLMALFGFPKAQENDAERAVRAALATLRALDELNARNTALRRPTLLARIGLDSGPVVVDATGEVFGEAPNVAARVQSAAEPGTLLVTSAVQRQVAGLFVVEDKGPHELKGVAGRTTLYRLVRASGGRRRAGPRLLTPLVGREEELLMLQRRWERTKNGEGQFVHLVGDPGLGKSRLLEEFRLRLAETPHTWTEWASSQLLQNTPLHPVAEWGRQRFAAEDRLGELKAALEQLELDPAEHVPLLAPLIGIADPGEPGLHDAGEDLRRRQLGSIVAWMFASARSQPIVLAFEDLQWADPTTLELMRALSERGAQVPLLIIASSRPDFRPSWPTLSHHGVIALAPLDRSQIAEMVSAIAARSALSKDVVEGLADRTAGVPLFIEELTRLMLEGNAQFIPPTLQQSLAARLDRLGDARGVAQVGAVLGREFSHALISSVADLPQPALEAALKELGDTELLFVDGVAPACVYRFKHALIRDAAYDSLLKSRRQALHQRAAEALVASPDPQPELVAHHFTQGGQVDASVDWWRRAGEAALKRSAFPEAVAHLGKAITIIDEQSHRDRVGDGSAPRGDGVPQWRALEPTVRVNYARAIMLGDSFASPQSRTASLRALRSVETSQAAERFDANYVAWITHFIGGDMATAGALADAFLTEAESASLTTERAAGLRMVGATRMFQGQFVAAKTCLERALDPGLRATDMRDRFRFFDDHEAMTKVTLAATEWFLGHVETAHALAQDALAIAEGLRHPPTICAVRSYRGTLYVRQQNPQAARDEAAALQTLAAEHGMPVYSAIAELLASWAQLQTRRSDGDIGQLRKSVVALENADHRHIAPFANLLLAEAEYATGDDAAALATVESVLTAIDESGIGRESADAWRLSADVVALRDPASFQPAERRYLTSIEIARGQGARALELRSALSFARFLQMSGRRREAIDALARALEGFTSATDLPAVGEAQKLLRALAES